ncbi:hypothetical protein CBS101457_002162 [Exobasidium rhododendri]|nr:hypothetical protein CBS101457_002162 [Exobasidium rhododendri]
MPATTIIVPRDDESDSPILSLDAFPHTGVPLHPKKSGFELYSSIGSPKHVVAPMVDQSELAWRILSRRYDSHLIYTPMINARSFAAKVKAKGVHNQTEFWIAERSDEQEEGRSILGGDDGGGAIGSDRPLIAQFAGHEPESLLAAAQAVEEHCDAIDLNLGCPQDIARRGHYGSFLQSDWQLIFRLINTLHINLRIPVTAKMRVFESTERTVSYALMMERAGAQMITVHGRTREMKGHKTGLADWKKIKAVKEAVQVPVFANGNILFHEDVDDAIQSTEAEGVMSAEGNLYNPTLFAKAPSTSTQLYPLAPYLSFPRLTMLIEEYLDICARLKTPTRASSIKSHIFRLARPALEIHRDLRPVLGKCTITGSEKGKGQYEQFFNFHSKLCELLSKDEEDERYTSQVSKSIVQFRSSGKEGEDLPYIPHWLAQPYYRKTLPPVDESVEEKEARRVKRKQRVEQTEGLDEPDSGIEEQESTSKKLRTLLGDAQAIKVEANLLFQKQQFDDAIIKYTEVLDVLPSRAIEEAEEEEENATAEQNHLKERRDEVTIVSSVEGEEESEEVMGQIRILRSVIFANLAACHLKKDDLKEAVIACNSSLLDDPLYLKALNRRAQANEGIGSWSSLTSSLEDYKTMNAMPHPASLQPSLNAALKRIPSLITSTSEKEKEEMMGKLKGLGDSVLGYFGLSTNNFQFQKGEGGGYNLNFVK